LKEERLTNADLKDEKKVMRRLRCALPSLQIKEWQLLGEGWEFILYLVNRKIVFKLPKSAHAENALACEIDILSQLEPYSPTPIPKIVHVLQPSRHIDRLVVGLSYLPGDQLETEFIYRLTSKQQQKLVDDLFQFLHFLHSFPYSQTNFESKIHFFEPYSDGLETWNRAKPIIYDHLPSQQRAALSNWLEEYFSDTSNFDITPALTHNDLTMANILCDYSNGSLAGIIDFGNLLITDPDYDIAQLSLNLGPYFAEKIFLKFGKHNLVQLKKKISFYNLMDNFYLLTDKHYNFSSGSLEHILSKICKTPLP
jgi:aminoglycoside 2''-phosphotransferase